MNTTNVWDMVGIDFTVSFFLEEILFEKRENEWLDFGSLPDADGSEDLLDPQVGVESTIAGNHTSGSSNLKILGKNLR